MSEKYENLRRNRDLANWNQRRFEQEVAEEIGVGRENREGSRVTKPGQSHTGGTGGTTGKEGGFGGGNTGNTGQKSGNTGSGHSQRPRC